MDFYITEAIGPYAAVARATNTFTTKQDVSPAPVPVIPGGKLRRASKISIYAQGDYSSLTGAVLTMGLWHGTRALSISGDIALDGAFTTGTTPAAWPWVMEWEGVCLTEGTSGTLLGQGELKFGSSLTAFNADRVFPVSAALRTVTIDTTIERAIGVSATWGASSASNQVTVNTHRVTIHN